MSCHLVIPDTQIKPGDNLDFLKAIGNYIVAKKPDTVVCIGDFADMPSLSSYDVGKKSFEGRRYKSDIEAVQEGMGSLLAPLNTYNALQRKNKHSLYFPRLVLTLGNHEDRISRATNNDSKLDGTIGIEDLKYAEAGWEVYPFLQPVVIDGIAYCHYFTTGIAGRPASSAQLQLSKKHMSCISGHQQGRQVAYAYKADGKRVTSIIAGSCYEHQEDYLGPQGNKHWQGIIMLHEVDNGEFDEMFVSLKYLKNNYL
jgi:hypothetical protein